MTPVALAPDLERPRTLRPEHRAHLQTSGLTDKTIEQAGIHSITAPMARALGFAGTVTGICFPYDDCPIVVRGTEVPYCRLRVDAERVRRDGLKYENPLGKAIEEGLSYYPYIPQPVAALRKRAEVPIFITEGEKKALKLTQEGFDSIGLPGVFMFSDPISKKPAADKPLHPYLARWRLRHRIVFVCFDSDRAEKDSVALAQERLCRLLARAGAIVRIVRIPRAPGEKVGADDFLVERGAAAFRALVDQARPWVPWIDFLDLLPEEVPDRAAAVAIEALAPRLKGSSGAERRRLAEAIGEKLPSLRPGEILAALAGSRKRPGASQTEPPCIQVNNRQVRDISGEAWSTLLASESGSCLFRRSRELVLVETDGPVTVGADLLTSLHNRAATWIKVTDAGEQNSRVDRAVVADMLALPDPRVPRLDIIVHSPVFLSDGRLMAEGGYDPANRLLHIADAALTPAVAALPERPSRGELAAARSLLLEEMMGDFPFASDAAKAHALAALIQPFVRRLIRGPTPLFVIQAPSPGSGKGLLADVIHVCVTGRPGQPMVLPRSEPETRKKLTALLRTSPQVVFLDNVAHAIASETLASTLTTEDPQDRRLGKSEMMSLPNRALWLATANNPTFSAEIARRTVHCRIDPGVAEPWTRDEFRHRKLLEWVCRTRPQLVGAVLTLVLGWLAAGRPRGVGKLGSFESWVEVLGGILAVAEVPGFLADHNERTVFVDPEEADWANLVSFWFEAEGHGLVDSRRLQTIAIKHQLLDLDQHSLEKAQDRSRFSKALAGRRDRVYGPHKIQLDRDRKRRQNLYRLVPA